MDRKLTPELMDEADASRADLDASLRFIRGINRRLGGITALTRELDRWRLAPEANWPRNKPIEILDIATGSADIPVGVVRWAKQHGVEVRVTGIDLHPVTLNLGRAFVDAELRGAERACVELLEADAFGLVDRFGANSFDFVHAGMFLHHLREIRVLTMLAIMDRLARRGVVWNDLIRSRIARVGIHALTIGQRPIVQHDARVSVEAGFTKREAHDLASRAGWHQPRVWTSFLQQRFVVSSAPQHPFVEPTP